MTTYALFMKNWLTPVAAATLAVFALLGMLVTPAFAGHNGAVVDIKAAACGETIFTAAVADSGGAHKVANMRLVVHDGKDTRVSGFIPTDGSTTSITVGPFEATTTLMWRVFGGGERDYDQPLWNGHGRGTFVTDINAYIIASGTAWLIGGPDEPNPFTTWNELVVAGCPPPTVPPPPPPAASAGIFACMRGGWEGDGFRNQGQCIRFALTGKDSRSFTPPRLLNDIFSRIFGNGKAKAVGRPF